MVSNGKYVSLEISPTINKNTTEYNAEGSWVDSNNISFQDGRPQKRGGYQARNLDRPLTGVARDIHSFLELSKIPHFMVGTHQRLEIEQLGMLYDITPIESSASVSNAITTSSGSSIVTVSSPGHDQQVGNFVLFTSVSSISAGGIDFQGNIYEITSVISTDSFLIEVSSSATDTSANVGGAIKLDYLLAPGLQSNGADYGYGGGTYGTFGVSVSAGWSEPRGGSGLDVELRQWSLDNWGEDGLACPRGGKIYIWDATTSVETRATAITAAPSANNFILVSQPRRQIVSYGCVPETATSTVDPLQIRWSDRENYNKWTSSAGSRGGGYRLNKGNEIITAVPTKQEILVLTDSAVFSQRPLDNEFVFGFDLVSDNAGAISSHAAVNIDGVVYWCGNNKNFYTYDGIVRNLPCEVDDFFFNDINYDQKEKSFMGVNREKTEWILLYQSNDSLSGDIDKYIKYNFQEGSWDVGVLDRVVWEDSGVYENPIGVNASGVVYNEESGTDADGQALPSFIESSYFDIEEGTNVFLVDKMIPDLVMSGTVNFTIYTKKYPNGPETVKGPYIITPTTESVHFRARGRQAKIRFSTSVVGSNWELGKPRYRVKEDGER